MRMVDVCAGIGGFSLAATWAGYEVAGQVEIDPWCRRVLAKHWPDAVRMNDVFEVRGDEFGPIDLLTAGIPCQPYSVAGKRLGSGDDRALWPAVRTIIEVAKPPRVCIENVAGFIGMALDGVSADLESLGYEVQSFVIPAAAVGAPHRRDRVWILAELNDRTGANDGNATAEWRDGVAQSRGLRDVFSMAMEAEQTGLRLPDDSQQGASWQDDESVSAPGHHGSREGRGSGSHQPQSPRLPQRESADRFAFGELPQPQGDKRCQQAEGPEQMAGDYLHQRSTVLAREFRDGSSSAGSVRPSESIGELDSNLLADAGYGDGRGRSGDAGRHDANGHDTGRQEGSGGADECRADVADAACIGERTTDDQTGTVAPERDAWLESASGGIDNSTRKAVGGLGESVDGLPGWLVGPDRLNPWAGDWEGDISRTTTHEQDRTHKLKALGNAIVPQVAYEILRAWVTA